MVSELRMLAASPRKKFLALVVVASARITRLRRAPPTASSSSRERAEFTRATLFPLFFRNTMRQAVKIACRLHDYERHLAVRKGLLEPFPRNAPVVVEVGDGSAQRMDEAIESRFTDVDSEVHLWSDALLRRRLAFHADPSVIICSVPSVKVRTDPAHRRIVAESLRSRPPERLGVASPRRSAEA